MTDSAGPRTTAASVRGAVRAFVIPTAAGAWYALSAGARDPRRAVLRHLLRDGARRAPSVEELCAWTGRADSREARVVLFQMQRAGWLIGDVAPLPERNEPPGDRLPALLEALSDRRQALLVDESGLCVAAAGMDEATAQRVAGLAQVLHGLCRTLVSEEEKAVGVFQLTMGAEPSPGWTLCALDVGCSRLLLGTCGNVYRESDAIVELAALLLRRYE